MEKRNKRLISLAVAAALLVALAIWIIWSNTALEMTKWTISSSKLPEAFDGYRVAQVSDLHNAEMGKDNEKLLDTLRSADPDMIAITGDLIDYGNTDVALALRFTAKAMDIAPCYYVTGNHEADTAAYDELKAGLLEQGVIVLEDEGAVLERSGESISLLGINDPAFLQTYPNADFHDEIRAALNKLTDGEDAFTVLLSHRPELLDVYADAGVDLVLSGHAHGGQFRLPFIGGLIAPGQGLFPEYDAGLYTQGSVSMIVSRGIGNSLVPIRFNNCPELVLVELKHL